MREDVLLAARTDLDNSYHEADKNDTSNLFLEGPLLEVEVHNL
jgi:hypothetical protein